MNILPRVIDYFFPTFATNKWHIRKMQEAAERIEQERKQRVLKGEKIHVVFVCHRPQVWNALSSVCEAMMADPAYKVTIVTIPNKKQLPVIGLLHEHYEQEGADEYFAGFPCQVLKGYDEKSKKWIDLQQLCPDYVFFQVPYDACRPEQYQSRKVSLYTKVCYVHYGMPFMDGFILEESTPASFLRNLYFHFAEFKEMQEYYANKVPETPIHKRKRVIVTGYPKFDGVEQWIGCESDSWLSHKGDKFRIMWTPRWSVGEGNCTFFDYKDRFPEFMDDNQDMELLFRPHPQAFTEYVATKVMTQAEVDAYTKKYDEMPNASIDKQKQYLPSFYSTDVLVTDESSIIPEFFLTGKPIIFTYKETHLNSFAKAISKGFYWAKDWAELEGFLKDLKNGIDPLRETRQELIRNSYQIPEGGSGKKIAELIKEDFFQ